MAEVRAEQWRREREFHESLLNADTNLSNSHSMTHAGRVEEIRTAPLFSAKVLEKTTDFEVDYNSSTIILPQYGLIAKLIDEYSEETGKETVGPMDARHETKAIQTFDQGKSLDMEDKRLFVNINAPWSAFICGSQGSGKSHTLSCILEASLQDSRLGPLPKPLAAMVFHYDKFSGHSNTQVCESAYLASQGIDVKVLVSPTSYYRMKELYKNLAGFPADAKKPSVEPLFLRESHLNAERMLKLMAVEGEGNSSLYMESVTRILRSLALEFPGQSGLNYKEFKDRLACEGFAAGQETMLKMRLSLLESFMYPDNATGTTFTEIQPSKDKKKGEMAKEKRKLELKDERIRRSLGKQIVWSFEPGSLTIVDLSCPFVNEGDACALFNICLGLFLDQRGDSGRILALDEAHKYMADSKSGNAFTETLLSVIRQQRHLATRVIIATQEPTISPSLLDLCSMTLVHRFTSPAWLKALEDHLAGLSMEGEGSKEKLRRIFRRIVELNAGQALLFCPSAILKAHDTKDMSKPSMEILGTSYVKIQVRKRLTADGGRSIMAA